VKKNGIDAGCQKIHNNDDEEDEDDDGNTSANVTVKKIICWLLKRREKQLKMNDKSLSDHPQPFKQSTGDFKTCEKVLRAVTTITYIITESWFIICCLARWHHQ
jgi:hypothetical protein